MALPWIRVAGSTGPSASRAATSRDNQLELELPALFGALVVTVVVAACYHLAGRPALAVRYPLTFWWVDLAAIPLAVVLAGEFLSRLAARTELTRGGDALDVLTVAGLHLAGVWLVARGIELVVWRGFFTERTGRSAPALLKGLTYTLLLVAALALFLWWVDYPVTGFLVSTGVLAGILGFALQNTLNDLFSGIALSLERPFYMGDWIELENGTVGQVVDMTWRSTRLKTFNNTIVAVPNSALASLHITNLDRPTPPYSAWYFIKLSPEIEPRLAVTLLSSAIGRCRHVLAQPAPVVRLNDAQESPYSYMVWVHYRSYLAHFKAQEEVFREIHAALRDANVRPAAPFHEVKLERVQPVSPIAPNIGQALSAFELFGNLDAAALDQIASGSYYSLIEADAELVAEGAEITKVQILVSGSLRGVVTLPSGRTIEAVELTPGESLGWAALVCGERAPMTVTAAVDSLVVEIDGECLKPVLQANDQLKERLAKLVVERMQRASSARVAGSGTPAKARTTEEILERIERFLSRSSR